MCNTESTFIISLHSCNHIELPDKALRGCDVIMLFNYVQEAYLSGYGSVIGEFLPEAIRGDHVATEVGVRKVKSVNGIQQEPPLGGDCFWQFEKVLYPLNGNAISYGDHCRIKHVLTQQYLAVTQRGHEECLMLKRIEAGGTTDPEISFKLIPDTERTDVVTKGYYIKINHIQSGMNLSVRSILHSYRNSKWFKLGLEDDKDNSRQYFQITEVKPGVIHDFYYICGVNSQLRESMQNLMAVSKSFSYPPSLDELIQVLGQFLEWFQGEGCLDRHNLKMKAFKKSQGIDLLIGFLHESESQKYKENFRYLNFEKLCDAIADVLLKFVSSTKSKSLLYLTEEKFINILLAKCISNIKFKRFLTNLASNESIAASRIVQKINLDEMLLLLKNTRDSTFLDFMGNVCLNAGKSVQDAICKGLMAHDMSTFMQTQIKEGVIWFIHPENLIGPISSICSKETYSSNKKLCDFFIAQLKFFSQVFKGVNTEAIDLIKFGTFDEVLISIGDPDLHPLVKSAYIDYAASTYISNWVQSDGIYFYNISHTFLWEPMCLHSGKRGDFANAYTCACAAIKQREEIKCLKDSISSFLIQNKALCAEEETGGHNELIYHMLTVIESLVSHCFYWKDSDVSGLISILMEILDGRTDLPKHDSFPWKVAEYQKGERYNYNENNHKIFRIKLKVVHILQHFLEMSVFAALVNLMQDFKYMKSESMEVSSTDSYTPVNSSLAALLSQNYQLNKQDPMIAAFVCTRLKDMLSVSYSCFGTDKSEIKDILIDLFHYEDDDLRLSSITLLFDMHQKESKLFYHASVSCIVTQESEDINSFMYSHASFFDQSKILMKMLQGATTPGHELYDSTVQVLKKIRSLCMVDNDETRPHANNQNIALCSGLLSVLLVYVQNFCMTEDTGQLDLLTLALSSMQAIVCGNAGAQRKLFAALVDIAKPKIAIAALARLMTEILSGNEQLCLTFSEVTVAQIFTKAATSNNPECFELFTTLETIMKPYKFNTVVLLKSYQKLIATIVFEHREESFYKILASNSQKERSNVLKDDSDDPDQLLKLLTMTDLLATTSEGECRHSENICQSIFSIEELVNIICNPEIPFDRKKPFARILYCSYQRSEGKSLLTLVPLMENSCFWSHVEECSILLGLVSKRLSLLRDKELELVKIRVRILFSQHYSFLTWNERSKEFDVFITSDCNGTISLSSLLCYLLDGLFPVIQSFCIQVLAANSQSNTRGQEYSCLLYCPSVIATLKLFSDSFLELLWHHSSVFMTTPEMVHYWTLLVDLMASVLPLDEIDKLNEARNALFLNESKYLVSSGLHYLSDEIELNSQFQKFISNLEITYEGSDPGHTRNLHVSGPSFNELMKLFTGEKECPVLLPLMGIVDRKYHLPLSLRERANIDFVLLTSLRLLVGVIDGRIKNVNQKLMKSNPELFEKEYSKKVKPMQDALIEAGAHEKIIFLLFHPKDEILTQILAFLSRLLHFGNKNSQEKLSHLISDTRIFACINKLLKGATGTLSQSYYRHKNYSRASSSARCVRQSQESELGHAISSETVRLASPVIVEIIGETMEATFSSELGEMTSVCAYACIERFRHLKTSFNKAREQAVVVLDVISSICDGQNQEMQNTLRKQENDFFSVNIVSLVTVLFQTLAENYNKYLFIPTRKAIQALIEMCAGNFSNREVACKNQIVNSINIILSWSHAATSAEARELFSIKSSAIELLEVMIEETHSESKNFAHGIAQDLCLKNILLTMRKIWELHHCHFSTKRIRSDIPVLFRAYHVLRKIADYTDTPVKKLVCYDELCKNDVVMKDLWAYLENYSRSIEINYITRDGEELLTKVYFQFAPVLTESEKSLVLQNIKRDTLEDKVKDLLKWMKAIKKNVKHKAMINNNRYMYWAVAGSNMRHILLFYLTLLLNLFVLFLFKIPENDNSSANYTVVTEREIVLVPSVASWFSDYLLYILGTVHLVLSIWMVTEYCVYAAPNIFIRIPLLSEILNLDIISNLMVFLSEHGMMKIVQFLITNKQKNSNYFKVNFFSFSTLYRIIFLLFSIAALTTSSYFYCGCILYVFIRSNVLNYVLTALARSALQLISVALLGLSILLIFAVFSFILWHNYFDNVHRFCETMVECYVSVIREGLLDTLGIMIPIQYVNQSEPSFSLYTSRAVFDLTFFIIITILGLNVVVAIIIDRFSELRSERDKINRDQRNCCFICGIDNDTFERNAEGFTHHVLFDHNMWNYVYFYLHLDSIHKNDHNAIEKYISDNIEEQKTEFFPLRKAKVLGGKVIATAAMES
ncbi:PREDICTED: uncharacterized protein LOC109580894 isoform X2 [Amphimedon queenslandica]|nr:PREDICTED: uncharacterized protein LOC109580894 isoform X2 [Amphimedon queenslandica]|eukprot:XP_019850014.1 PREDICTED: uncharacterized protein LOC109580894 isoform X2 [Amphimedon queenslandica]